MPAKNHLSQNQKQRLIKILKESDDNYVREKVLILLLINDGKTYQKISEFMEIAYTTVAYWSVHGDPDNLDIFLDKRSPGNFRKVTPDHPSGDGKSTVEFIKYLQNKYKNRKIILSWDGASYHKYGEFREFLLELNGGKEPDNWPITCILFASNAPQQNPVKDIWLPDKNFLRKYWYLCRSFKIVKFLERLFH